MSRTLPITRSLSTPHRQGAGLRCGTVRIVFLILIVGVLVPAACVLLFMVDTMRNSQLAMRQQLTDLYRQQLVWDQQLITKIWDQRVAFIHETDESLPTEQFARLAADGVAVVIRDHDGKPLYPFDVTPMTSEPRYDDSPWHAAEAAESRARSSHNWAAAAAAWQVLMDRQYPQVIRDRAAIAAARCLVSAGQKKQAILSLFEVGDNLYSRDETGRLLRPAAMMRALELMSPDDKRRPPLLVQLEKILADYKVIMMPSAQRLFLLKEFRELFGERESLRALERAEELAARFLESKSQPPTSSGFLPTQADRLWAMAITTPGQRTITCLASDDDIQRDFMRTMSDLPRSDARSLVAPNTTTGPAPLAEVYAGAYLPGWRIVATIQGKDPFAPLLARQRLIYMLVGSTGISAILLVGVLMAGFVGRQMRLTRLKNDLIATVSHELKTPLAGMRVLVDTMLEGRCSSPQQQREYLEMIARENLRLSRLIENFLTFSRMERQKKLALQDTVNVAEMIRAAIERVSLMHNGGSPETQSHLQDIVVQQVDPNLVVRGDSESLTTVISNLVDNAYKYSQDDKHMEIAARRDAQMVVIEVKDHGIGISPRHQKKIFQRFWQVDRRLSRDAGGCGLGLAIVKYIVEQHGGSISVQSMPNVGSTFTVRLPES